MHPILDYVLSIHYLPTGSSVLLSCLAAAWGVDWKTCFVMTCAGSLVTCAVFYVQPLQCFSPLGGNFNVGTREVCGDRGAMKPPVTVVYPTPSGTPRSGIQYVPFGDRGYLVGMASYTKVPYVLVKDLCLLRRKMRSNADPAPLFQRDGIPRPMILFSHGLGGFPHLYSTLLMDLAARGAIVFAVSHMDGSAAYCRDAGRDLRVPLNTQVGWTTEDRAPQLEVRIRETLNTIKRIRNGELLLALGYDRKTVDTYIAMEPRVHLVGHSFGGATCLAAALNDTQDASERGGVSSIASTVVYDPWMIPLRKTMFYDKLTDKKQSVHFTTPTLQVFSEEWVRSKEQHAFFEEVKAIVDAQPRTTEESALVAAVDAKLKVMRTSWYTMKDYRGTGHLSCTDVSLFSPVLHRAAYMTASPRGSIVALAADTLLFIEKVSGPLPLDTKLLNNSALAATPKA